VKSVFIPFRAAKVFQPYSVFTSPFFHIAFVSNSNFSLSLYFVLSILLFFMTAPCCFCSIFVAVNRIWTRLDNFQIYLFKNFRRQARQFIGYIYCSDGSILVGGLSFKRLNHFATRKAIYSVRPIGLNESF